MKKRINYGVSHRFDHGPMVRSEGARHNFLSTPNFSPENITNAKLICSRRHPKFPGISAWVFELDPQSPFHINLSGDTKQESLSYTFSVFAEIPSHPPLTLKVTLSDNEETIVDYFLVTEKITKFEISHEFSTPPKSLYIGISQESSSLENDKIQELLLICPVLEEGLFSSSAIINQYRDADQICIESEERLICPNLGTIYLIFVPLWTGSQLSSDQKAYFFDTASYDYKNSINIFADGADFGKLKACIVVDGDTKTISTDIIPTRGSMFSIALRWASGLVDLVINGRAVTTESGVFITDSVSLENKMYYGSTGRSKYLSAFSNMGGLYIYKQWVSDKNLRAFSYQLYPSNYPSFQDDWLELANGSEPKVIKNDSPYFPIIVVLLRLQATWQKSPPIWILKESLNESDARDEVLRLFESREDYYCHAEDQSHEGRTDLVVGIDDKTVRIEFKIWGRNDYKEVPQKPLKYFIEGESVGVSIMINPNKSKSINTEYYENVKTTDTGFCGIIKEPFMSESYPFHFISNHCSGRTDEVEILHIVINRQGPFATKELPI